MKFLAALLVICSMQAVLSQKTFDGQCPQVPVLKDFNLQAYMKTWWGIQRYPFLSLTKCTRAIYKNPSGNVIDYLNVGLDRVTGKISTLAFPAKYFGSGLFLIKYNNNQPSDSPNYQVIFNNGKAAAVTWCKNINASQHEKIAFVLASSPKYDVASVEEAREALKQAHVDLKYLENYQLEGCA